MTLRERARFELAVRRHDLELWWQNRIVWKVLRLIPRNLIYWGAVGAAVRAAGGGNPGEVTIIQIMDELYPRESRPDDVG